MNKTATRLVSAFVLACWMAPSAGALGVGLHLALGHHDAPAQGHHGAEHALDLAELAQAAAHGHHHQAEAAPDHDHDARVDGTVPALKPSTSPCAVLPAVVAPEVALAERTFAGGSPRRGPPVPLFNAYCSLLL